MNSGEGVPKLSDILPAGNARPGPKAAARKKGVLNLGVSRIALLVVVAAALTSASAVGATAATTTIDFDSLTGPSRFCPPAASPPLTIGAATFTGGAILSAVEGLPANQSTVYGTASGCADLACPITITFATPVDSFSVDVLNGALEPVSYTVTDNL